MIPSSERRPYPTSIPRRRATSLRPPNLVSCAARSSRPAATSCASVGITILLFSPTCRLQLNEHPTVLLSCGGPKAGPLRTSRARVCATERVSTAKESEKGPQYRYGARRRSGSRPSRAPNTFWPPCLTTSRCRSSRPSSEKRREDGICERRRSKQGKNTPAWREEGYSNRTHLGLMRVPQWGVTLPSCLVAIR